MAGENGRGHRSRQNVAVLLVLCALAPSLTCFSLRGLSKRVKQGKVVDEATVTDIRTGSILFNGKELNSRSGSASAATTGKDELLHVESDQSDGTGWSSGRRQDMDSREASWRRMASSLQCGGDHLKFRAVGPGASQFVVEQGNAPPMPLSQVPSTCGYNIQRNSLALVMLVPYDGCNMVQEGGSYVLPMRWQGVPVLLRCPKTTTAAPTTTTVPVRTTAPTTKTPEMPHFPQYPPFPPYYPYFTPPPTTTAAAPTTTAAASTTKTPEMPHFPQYPLFPPYYPYFTPPPPTTTAAAPTTTAAAPTTTAAAPTTTAAASTTKTPKMPHFPQYPLFPPFYPYFTPPPATTAATAPTTTAAAPTTKTPKMPHFPQYPFFPPFYPYFPPPLPTTTAAPTTTAKPAATALPQFPFPLYPPYFTKFPWHFR